MGISRSRTFLTVSRNIAQGLYVCWALATFSALMLVLLPFIIPLLFLGRTAGRAAFALIRTWAFLFSVLAAIRYSIERRAAIQMDKPCIFIANHTSFLDAPGLAMAIPTRFRPLGKRQLLKIPLFGLLVKVAAVVVDRSSAESRKASVDQLKATLANGIPILIFPEGTQNRTAEPLQPFFDGAFRIAIETQAPLVPIVTLGAARLLPPGTLALRPGRIQVIVGAPIPVTTRDEADFGVLRDTAHAIMENLIQSGGQVNDLL